MRRQIIFLLLSLAVLVFVVITVLGMRGDLGRTIELLREAKWGWLLLIIPNTVLMFYAAGRIWYPYVGDKISAWELASIQYEQNFITTATPAGEVSAFFYDVERMKKFGVSGGLASALYIWRYVASISTNLLGMVLAILILLAIGRLREVSMGALIAIALILAITIVGVIFLLAALAGRIQFRNEKVKKFVNELSEGLNIVAHNKRAMLKSLIWGMWYTCFEDLPFLIVGLAFGYPWIYLEIIVASAAGNFADVLFPNPAAVGGFEAAMIWLLRGLGVGVAVASSLVMVERVVFILITLITGYPLFCRGMQKIK